MLQQLGFKLALTVPVGHRDEVEDVRVLGQVLGQIRVRRRQGRLEVGDGFARALTELGVDLVHQNVSRPAVFDSRRGIPEPDARILQLLKQDDVVPPGQLCNAALHNCGVGPRGGELAHVLEVPR
jgi:hypothetical protein